MHSRGGFLEFFASILADSRECYINLFLCYLLKQAFKEDNFQLFTIQC